MSNPVSLHCPHCGTKLKIKDRSLFGQSVKCPGCKKPFVLRDPNEPVAAPAQKASKPAFPDFSKLGGDEFEDDLPPLFAGSKGSEIRGVPPAESSPFPVGFNLPGPNASPNAPLSSPALPVAGPVIPIDLPIPAGTDVLLRLKKKKSGKWFNIGMSAVLGIAAIGLIAYFATMEKTAPRPSTQQHGIAGSDPVERPLDPNQPYSKLLLEQEAELVTEFKPTQGQPIELYLMPSGINMLIHLRPAQLWSEDYNYKVLRASLTDDVMSWMGDQIKSICLRDPAQIEELTIGVLLGARGTPPQYCCVVKLAQPEKLSNLIELFPGKYLYDITERPDLRVKVDEQRGYLIQDEKTYAICPVSMAGDLEYSIKTPNQDISVGMADLLQRTDRQRLFTAVADARDLQIHKNVLVPQAAQPFVNAMTEWLGEDVEMASWSLHPEPYFHSEVALCPVTTKGVAGLEADVQAKLEQLPQKVWKDLCARMKPREMRFRSLIGRLPAMLEAFEESTVSHHEKTCVLLTTVLPAKATPNLALATMFTIDEASRTNFTETSLAANQGTAAKLPETVAERMKKLPVDAEFNRTPFEQAVTYLCNEIQVKLVVDGDALKDAGYTKNMPQTFNLGKVPMQRALFEIVNAYQEKGKEMVISVDEATKTITVLTKKFAEAKGLPVFPLKAE